MLTFWHLAAGIGLGAAMYLFADFIIMAFTGQAVMAMTIGWYMLAVVLVALFAILVWDTWKNR